MPSIYENGMYYRLYDLSTKLKPWFDIDKIKPFAVYVWTKGLEGENVFDIFAEKIQFYTCEAPWEMPNEAMEIIKKIQDVLKEIAEYNREYFKEE